MECDSVIEYLRERSLKFARESSDFVTAHAGSLKIAFWCPREDFTTFDDVEDARKSLRLDSIDVLVVVAYRPFVLVDYLASLLERAQRWYGVNFGVKLLGVSSVDLEVGLEEALGRAFAEKPERLGDGLVTEYICPQCTKERLRLYRQEKIWSRKWRGRAIESIYACSSCGFKTRRLELLD